MFSNGFINACKHTVDRKIFVRVKVVEGLLLVEIINSAPEFSLTEEQLDNIFTPFFLKTGEKEELWDNTVLKKFRLDHQFFNKIKPNFGYDLLKNTVKVEPDPSKQFTETGSTGLGLGLARLIAKNLGGELSIQFDSEKKMVRFWFAIKIGRDPTVSRDSHDSDDPHDSQEVDPQEVDVQVI